MEPFAVSSCRQSCGVQSVVVLVEGTVWTPIWNLMETCSAMCFTGSMETRTPLSFRLDCKLS